MKNLIERAEYLMCKRKPYLKNKQKRLRLKDCLQLKAARR